MKRLTTCLSVLALVVGAWVAVAPAGVGLAHAQDDEERVYLPLLVAGAPPPARPPGVTPDVWLPTPVPYPTDHPCCWPAPPAPSAGVASVATAGAGTVATATGGAPTPSGTPATSGALPTALPLK